MNICNAPTILCITHFCLVGNKQTTAGNDLTRSCSVPPKAHVGIVGFVLYSHVAMYRAVSFLFSLFVVGYRFPQWNSFENSSLCMLLHSAAVYYSATACDCLLLYLYGRCQPTSLVGTCDSNRSVEDKPLRRSLN